MTRAVTVVVLGYVFLATSNLADAWVFPRLPSSRENSPFYSNSSNDSEDSSNQKDRRWAIKALGAAVALPASAELYARTGKGFVRSFFSADSAWDDIVELLYYRNEGESQSQEFADRDMTIVFHGADGPDEYTDELMKRLQVSPASTGNRQHEVVFVNWKEASKDLLRASFNGERVGRYVARRLLMQPEKERTKGLHFIGISVGAFPANACLAESKRILGKKKTSDSKDADPFRQLTLLDPFTTRGVVGMGYGNHNFGVDADYAQQYFNSDDPVPSTNEPLTRNCDVCYDVTSLREEAIFGHDWPLVYYTRYTPNQQFGFLDENTMVKPSLGNKIRIPKEKMC